MGFVENLRMASLFPTSAFGKIPKIPYSRRDPFREVIEESTPGDNAPTALNLQLIRDAQNRPLESETTSKQQPQNVMYKEPMTPFQRESLNLRDRGLDLTESRNLANIDLARDRNRIQNERTGIQRARTDIQKQRADIYEFKAKNPNLRFDFTGPTVKIARIYGI